MYLVLSSMAGNVFIIQFFLSFLPSRTTSYYPYLVNNLSASISRQQRLHSSIFLLFSSSNNYIYSDHVPPILFNFIFFSSSSYHVRYITPYTRIIYPFCIFFIHIYYCIYSRIHSQLFLF